MEIKRPRREASNTLPCTVVLQLHLHFPIRLLGERRDNFACTLQFSVFLFNFVDVQTYKTLKICDRLIS